MSKSDDHPSSVSKAGLETYFKHARTFDQDRLISAERSKRLAWSCALIAGVVATMAIGAVLALTPLKSVEPFVIRVDNSTGIVDVVTALNNDRQSYDEAVTKYFSATYIRAREGYTAGEAEHNFKTVSLLSSVPEQERFFSSYRGSNPESPQVVYGRFGSSRINIKSISVINKNVVSVRYFREARKGDETKISHWIATITFSYVKTPLSAGDRLTNPLGFVVTEYRSDPEAV